jgi:feruloyl esterase
LKVVADGAKAIIASYYQKKPRYSYFVGCSKGGQEGMAFAQRYPEEFNGIVAGAPGFSLPRAAVAEAWDVQAVAAVVAAPEVVEIPVAKISSAFSDPDLALVREAILSACDADDGLKDGMVNALSQCTDEKVFPALDSKVCKEAKAANCLSQGQALALKRIYGGAHDSGGKQLYAGWQWDPGIAGPGWRIWKMGSADGKVPALNVALGGASLAAVFTTPPTPVSADLQATLDFQMHFDFARDAGRIYVRDAEYKNSAWDDISARSADLSQFMAHGGKLIVPHGVSDPVFSIRDTLSWYDEVQQRSHGKAQRWIRVFPVPGMAHCGGGPATDQFDAFAALQDWVEHNRAPDRISASAGPGSPWPGRTRPLCPYPAIARYSGKGNIESAENFVCR